jgi:ABC-type uncharacterized transport system substrate-binding protein
MINRAKKTMQYDSQNIKKMKRNLELDCLYTARILDELRDEKKIATEDKATMANVQSKIVTIIARKRMLRALHQELDRLFTVETDN